MRYSAVAKILKEKGWFFDRINGSHHIFVKPGAGSYSVPVHRRKVKYIYVRKIETLK